jgi:phosphate starvation-inducible protein PhoH
LSPSAFIPPGQYLVTKNVKIPLRYCQIYRRKYLALQGLGESHLSRQRAQKAQKRMNLEVANTIAFNSTQRAQPRRIDLIPRTRNQERLVMALQDPAQHIVVTAGPAGTGKTYLAMLAAVKNLREGVCDRIVLTRPAVGVEGESHGFLPGNLVAKMEPWTRPLLDVMREYYRPQDILAMIEDQILEISPLAYMRGRTFKNSWIIADEMQNATPAQVKMLMTRIGQTFQDSDHRRCGSSRPCSRIAMVCWIYVRNWDKRQSQELLCAKCKLVTCNATASLGQC